MSKQPKITKDELKKELEKGRSYKGIAYEYGYGYPSRVLDDKFRELGYSKNKSLNKRDEYGGTTVYLGGEVIESAIEQAGLEDKNNICITEKAENGKIVIDLTEREWSKKQE